MTVTTQFTTANVAVQAVDIAPRVTERKVIALKMRRIVATLNMVARVRLQLAWNAYKAIRELKGIPVAEGSHPGEDTLEQMSNYTVTFYEDGTLYWTDESAVDHYIWDIDSFDYLWNFASRKVDPIH